MNYLFTWFKGSHCSLGWSTIVDSQFTLLAGL